jgi:tRNA(Ile)-lysidine synthetase-like protein
MLHEFGNLIPTGRWLIGVSGGADSVALLHLLLKNPALSLHIGHLDHETRAGESTRDAEFVRTLAAPLNLPFTVQTRSALEPRLGDLPANTSARFRKLRLAFFGEIVAARQLKGVILAHHADDQAETILQRLLRGSGASGLTGMSPDSCIGGLRILRPLIRVRSQTLRDYLCDQQISWRDDASNQLQIQQRNRVRRLLRSRPQLTEPLLALGEACRELTQWLRANAPRLKESFAASQLANLPEPLAREAACRWLVRRSKQTSISSDSLDRLLTMCRDAGAPPRQDFPGNLHVRRRRGIISAESPRALLPESPASS